ncbi:hypothetical protein BGZ61DRAFT_481579 [Ilyonectria robusta]|uniref:uncharacterized protein n=1 Tax=Ilyonectria robusta TaxID=1079257 RepID=UPI001E8D0C39|nr:uncharacterized protein BGZ61DRAFT_481579 [Ilyonectria robusta]KAH8676950.1 hypothetical protein BGZ61DRAFT_481579 [Ilyonectria robusta]
MQQTPGKDDYGYDLGTYHRQVTAATDDSQTWFDRGLVWAYAFNHEESVVCFERAIESDASCAMAYWGLAYSVGPNYNKQWSFFDDTDLAIAVGRGYKAAQLALANMAHVTPVEQALIKALQFRYPQEQPAPNCGAWNQGFADAMGTVYAAFVDDLDVITIYVDALMNLTPWQLWDLRTGEPTEGARTLEIKAIVDRALTLQGALQHPGLLHMYIHLMEMSPSPESALPVANHLRGLVPDGGHLHHMPSHLDVLCGRYQEAIESNAQASVADEKFLSRAGPLNFYTLYRSHDYHFSVYAAMFAGKYKVAIDTVAKVEASIPKSLLQVESPPMADWLEAFLTLRAHVAIRFGRWEDIIDLELPEDQNLYSTTTAILHYAKGVAFAATGRVQEADDQRALFKQAVTRVQASRTLFNNTCRDILGVAEAMLDGEIEYRRGNFDVAYEHLRQAMHREDNLPYDEPWGWMQPTRHAYGALSLEQGHVEQALEAYMADLGMDDTLSRALQHKNNVWALHGVHECLRKLGRTDAAKEAEGALAKAVTMADVPITASCFCRLETEDVGQESTHCRSGCKE